MTCPHCQGAADFFGERMARRELKRYRRKGPPRSTRLLLDALVDAGVKGATAMDIGAGVGAIQNELLARGAERVTSVDASPAYQEASLEEARARGIADRVAYRTGDFVELAPSLPAADVVTLDRVICCYPDMPALVDASASRARFLYGFVVPRDRWFVRLWMVAANLFMRARRSPFRVYLHDPAALDARVRGHGLFPRRTARTPFWEARVFERPENERGLPA